MNKNDNINFIFGAMQTKLNNLYEASNILDQKTSTFIGFSATIMAGLMIFFKDNLEISFSHCIINFFTLGIFFIFISILLCASALSTKKYYYPPNEEHLYSDKSLNSNYYDLVDQTVADMQKGFVENLKTHETKAMLFNLSIIILMIGLLVIFFALYEKK